MKKLPVNLWMMLSLILVSMSSCEAIKGIFKAGVWVGVLIVVAVIAVIVFIIRGIGGKK